MSANAVAVTRPQPAPLTVAQVQEIIAKAQAGRVCIRQMAREYGTSPETVHRVLALGLRTGQLVPLRLRERE